MFCRHSWLYLLFFYFQLLKTLLNYSIFIYYEIKITRVVIFINFIFDNSNIFEVFWILFLLLINRYAFTFILIIDIYYSSTLNLFPISIVVHFVSLFSQTRNVMQIIKTSKTHFQLEIFSKHDNLKCFTEAW